MIRYIILIPFLSIPRVLFFSGKNVTKFLKRFSDIYINYRVVTIEDKLNKLLGYDEKEIRSFIKLIVEY